MIAIILSALVTAMATAVLLLLIIRRSRYVKSQSQQTKVVDWRVWKAATVAAAGPPVEPGRIPIQTGDVLYVISTMQDPVVGKVNFITPSPVSLALNIAIRSARDAHTTRASIHWQAIGKISSEKWADATNLPVLFSYFEQSMAAATFSFQSLEAFTNQVVVQSINGKMKFKREKGEVEWDASSIERRCSTEEKLSVILPTLGNIKSPKGTKVWENFVKLKEVRDATIHMKELNQYARGTDDTQTLYYRFLQTDPREFPRWAIAMVRYFTPSRADGWLIPAEELLRH